MPTINRIEKKKKTTFHSETDIRKLRQSFYATTQWKNLRLTYLKEHPLCEECLKKGRVTPAVDIHHIKSFVQRGEINWGLGYNPDNLMALCKECHQEIHAKQQGYVSPEDIIKQLDMLFSEDISDKDLDNED